MTPILEPALPTEQFDVFEVVQLTRQTPLEHSVAVDLVTVPPGRTSQLHRHNGTDSVLYIVAGAGTVLVGDARLEARPGARIFIGKGVFHGVHTAGEPLTFISVQSPPILDRDRGLLDLEPLAP